MIWCEKKNELLKNSETSLCSQNGHKTAKHNTEKNQVLRQKNETAAAAVKLHFLRTLISIYGSETWWIFHERMQHQGGMGGIKFKKVWASRWISESNQSLFLFFHSKTPLRPIVFHDRFCCAVELTLEEYNDFFEMLSHIMTHDISLFVQVEHHQTSPNSQDQFEGNERKTKMS